MSSVGFRRYLPIILLASLLTNISTPSHAEEVGGFAVVHPDGHVCGVIVGSIAYFGGNDRVMGSEYMGCPVGARIIFQTKASETGNVAGYHGTGSNGQTTVTYDDTSKSFTVSNSTSPETLITQRHL